jgi:pyrroline-5-carboxylate reductase
MGIKIGVIGVGVIGSSIVNGFCSDGDKNNEMYLSPRNKQNVDNLAEKYENINKCESNQEVLDKSEWIIISVVPSKGEEILRNLKFRKNHKVINLMSDKKLEDIKVWIGETKILCHMVPLSFIENRRGPIVLFPENSEVKNLFSELGEVIEVNSRQKVETLATITGLMTSYYKLISEVTNWGSENGLSKKESFDYTTSFFSALSYKANISKEEGLKKLASEMTKGGLNEMAIKNIEKSNGIELWKDSLDLILERFKN